MANFFNEVYPFTTEMISGYVDFLNVKDKDILTVGSSFDQAFNFLLYGAKSVTVVDINERLKEFYQAKKEILLSSLRMDFYDKVLALNFPYDLDEVHIKKDVIKMNPYMQSDENFLNLKSILKEKDISIINDDIFKFDNIDKSYDRIIFSNVLQSIKSFILENPEEEFIKCFDMWKNHLKNEGLLQLIYIYSYNKTSFSSEYAFKLALTCLEEIFNIYKFESKNSLDAIIVYEKK